MKTGIVGTEGLDLHTVDVPETQEEAAARFVCPPTTCTLSGRACAMRYRSHARFARAKTRAEVRARDALAISPCCRCPAGAARLELLDLPPRRQRPDDRRREYGVRSRARADSTILGALEAADCALSSRELRGLGAPRDGTHLARLVQEGRVVKIEGHPPTYTIAEEDS